MDADRHAVPEAGEHALVLKRAAQAAALLLLL